MPKRSEDDKRDDEAMDEEEALFGEDKAPEDEAMDDEEEAEEDDSDDDEAMDEGPDEEAEDDEEDDEAEDDEPKKDARRAHRARASKRAPRSLAQLAGMPAGTSSPAIIGKLYPLVSLARHVMAETDSPCPSAAMGAFRAIADDAQKAGKLQAKLSRERRRNNKRERMALLRKLQKADIHPRGELFVDVIDDVTGERTIKAAPIWAEMKLSTLRQYTKQKLKGAAPRPEPAQPGPAPTDGATGRVTAEDRRLAQKHGYEPEKVAATRNALFGRKARS